MYFVLDLICAIIILGTMVRYWSHAISHILLKCLCVILSMGIAAVVTAPLGDHIGEVMTVPIVERQAANGLAELLAQPTGSDGRETVAQLEGIGALIEKAPEPYLQWLRTYAADEQRAAEAFANGGGEALLETVTADYSRGLTYGVCYLALTIALLLFSGFLVSRVEQNMTEPQRYRGIVRALPPLCGALCGVLGVMLLTLFLEWIVPPLCGDSLLLTTDMLTKGTIYPH